MFVHSILHDQSQISPGIWKSNFICHNCEYSIEQALGLPVGKRRIFTMPLENQLERDTAYIYLLQHNYTIFVSTKELMHAVLTQNYKTYVTIERTSSIARSTKEYQMRRMLVQKLVKKGRERPEYTNVLTHSVVTISQ
jgi:hypothetical protein